MLRHRVAHVEPVKPIPAGTVIVAGARLRARTVHARSAAGCQVPPCGQRRCALAVAAAARAGGLAALDNVANAGAAVRCAAPARARDAVAADAHVRRGAGDGAAVQPNGHGEDSRDKKDEDASEQPLEAPVSAARFRLRRWPVSHPAAVLGNGSKALHVCSSRVRELGAPSTYPARLGANEPFAIP